MREGLRTQPVFHICTVADAKIRAEVAALGTTQLKIGLQNLGYSENAKRSNCRSPWPKWKTLTGAPLWWTGDKGAPPSLQMLSVRERLQRKGEEPASASTTQTQLSTGEVINVFKQDDQGNKCTLTACCIGDIEETPQARYQDLQYPLWVFNADLFVEYDSVGFVPKLLFDVMMLGKDLTVYGDADVVHCTGRDIQRLWRIKRDKDPTTVPFDHAWLPVYSWLSGSVTSNMYRFDEHTMWIGATSR